MIAQACGQMMRKSRRAGERLSATLASHWPFGTALMAPRTTSAP